MYDFMTMVMIFFCVTNSSSSFLLLLLPSRHFSIDDFDAFRTFSLCLSLEKFRYCAGFLTLVFGGQPNT